VVLLLYGVAFGVILATIPRQYKTVAFIGLFAVTLAFFYGLRWVRLWTYGLGRDRKYDLALRLDEIWSWLPGYGASLKGSILFTAGRYHDVRELLASRALDAQGNPRVDTLEFYTYSLALINDGESAEAQRLLEAAIPRAESREPLQVALATCLLEGKKDPQRARSLLENVLSARPSSSPAAYTQRADDVRRLARYAWALGACGMKSDAELRMREALDRSTNFKPSDLAGVRYFVGEALRAMGENQRAREMFQQALALNPSDATVLSVRKALAKMDAGQ
jgi:tetratricopeptide (TPR) repeat protein